MLVLARIVLGKTSGACTTAAPSREAMANCSTLNWCCYEVYHSMGKPGRPIHIRSNNRCGRPRRSRGASICQRGSTWARSRKKCDCGSIRHQFKSPYMLRLHRRRQITYQEREIMSTAEPSYKITMPKRLAYGMSINPAGDRCANEHLRYCRKQQLRPGMRTPLLAHWLGIPHEATRELQLGNDSRPTMKARLQWFRTWCAKHNLEITS